MSEKMAPEGLWDDPLLPHLYVHDHDPIETGLLNHKGIAIVRMPRPIGFGRDKEWQNPYRLKS